MVEEQKRKEAVAAELKARMQREKQELQAKVADYQTPEWAKVVEEDVFTDEEEEEEKEEEVINDFYCVVCEKAYRSEKQFETHENSKRHLENVEILRQEMLADEANFGTENLDPGMPVDLEDVTNELEELELEEPVSNKKNKKKNKKKAAPRWGYDEEDVPENLEDVNVLAAALEEERTKRKKRGNKTSTATPTPTSEPAVSMVDGEPVTETEAVPIEKESAKTKREKRKEKKKLKEETDITEVRILRYFNMKRYTK